MAVVAYTSYNENIACQRTNDYLTNGHGTDAAARSNRYVSDGHGQTTLCVGHNCPSDPVLATEYMGFLRSNYERQHPPSKGRQKGSVTHVQFYVSPTEEDNVPAQERIDMTLELIQRTPLGNGYAALTVPHDNTPDKHCHISLCPYSVDGTRKLCLNNSLLNTLRREMDRICVEHGYSIIENRELWADPEYREWYFQIKEQGIIKIHPPKDQDMSSFKKDRNRARSYAVSKASQKKKQDDLESVCKYLSKKRLLGMEFFFYKSPYLYDPKGRDRHLHIRRTDIDGHKMGNLELQASSLMVWGSVSSQTLAQRNIPGSKDLQRRLDGIAKKAYAAKCLLRDLDIQTQAEFAVHKKECGQDLCELKKNIRYQEAIITDTAALMNAIECWENDHDQNAYTFLVEHQCEDDRNIAAAKTRYVRAIARKVACEELLLKRKAEYRHLKEAGIFPPRSRCSLSPLGRDCSSSMPFIRAGLLPVALSCVIRNDYLGIQTILLVLRRKVHASVNKNLIRFCLIGKPSKYQLVGFLNLDVCEAYSLNYSLISLVLHMVLLFRFLYFFQRNIKQKSIK